MNILFLCVGNSARSQIAEGLAKEMLGSDHNVQSAGSMPIGKIHPGALKTMKDIGIDISGHISKSIDDLDKDFINKLDYVITLCAEEVCPFVPSKAKMINWANEDPDNNLFSDIQSKNAFIKTRDNIFKLLKLFIIKELK